MSHYATLTPSSPIRLPKTQEHATEYEVQQSDNETVERYVLQTGFFDPSENSSPPNSFIGQLKQRMSVYYGALDTNHHNHHPK
jgi:hypothetical protein